MMFDPEVFQPDRPEPITTDLELFLANKRVDTSIIVDFLIKGNKVLVKDFYSSGLAILTSLKKQLKKKFPEQDFKTQREYRSVYRTASQNLLVLIKGQKAMLRKAPETGWLKTFYPGISEFFLSFPDFQGLNSSWQWYEKGIKIPCLRWKLHPYYGTYFPTRFEHLDLFSKWLKTYKGQRDSAIDIGTGCGVLAFLLLQEGFNHIYATDINKNAVFSVYEELHRNKLIGKVSLSVGDIFENIEVKSELIVINPPWIPAAYETKGIDKAIYYGHDFFPGFFSEAYEKLEKDGRVVILFSNLAQAEELTLIHPVEEELRKGQRFKKEELIRKRAGAASGKTIRKLERRKEEFVELWVLSKI
jgi:hypothetical protein